VNEPRNVTPDRDTADWSGWTWERRGTNFPWLGVLLILVGVALLLQFLVPTLSASTLVLLAVGLAFLAGWIFGRSWFAMVAGVLAFALGVAELIEDLALLGLPSEDVPGLWAAALAVGFLVIWLIGVATNRRSTWPLFGAAIFGLIGVAQLSGRLVGIPVLGALWPIVIIIVGIALLMSARRRSLG
jgi:hypothetical protein